MKLKRFLRLTVRFLMCGLVLTAGGVLALSLYYRNCFPVNTWINGIYCTGKSLEQVNEELISRELLQNGEAQVITITGAGGMSGTIHTGDVEVLPDFTGALEEYLNQHESVFWMKNLQSISVFQVAPEAFHWNEGRLRSAFEALSFVSEEKTKQTGVLVCYDEETGYCLRDGNAERLNAEKAYGYLKECLARGETHVNLVAGGCYEDEEDTPEDREQRSLWLELETFTDCRIVYDMGQESIPLTPDIVGRFLERTEVMEQPARDERGNLILDEAAVRSWVEELAGQYDTCGKEREFKTTAGETVTVQYGTYGTRLDVEAEVAYLMKAIQTSRDETEFHVPAYKQQGYARGLDDIGDTYIEIDMTRQHMYFYLKGELTLDTDVVTGDVAKRRETPEGVYFIYAKQKNRILRGGDYATPVDYWLPVVRGVGIHDANWRRSFGGEIYKTNGSHGCINTPIDIVSKLYDMVEVGIPVVMFYSGGQ